jgi:methionyl-tRNA formyltransferase
MRVVFMGTPEFAVPSLEALRAEHEVVAVYSRPDRPSGRGRVVSPTPVKSAAQAAGIEVRQPERLSDPVEVARLVADRPDVIVVAAFGAILPRSVLDVPSLGCVNVHASLLPRWRGAAPIQRAILAGDLQTGVSIMRMEEGLDTGPWCAQVRTDVAAKDAAELTAELAALGADLLTRTLSKIADGTALWHPQDESLVTYAAKVTAADVEIAPSMTVGEALARVRASGPSAPCRVTVGGRNLTVLRAEVSPDPLPAGAARCTRHLELGCSDGALRLLTIVPEGRAPMEADAFVRGARLDPECIWSPR